MKTTINTLCIKHTILDEKGLPKKYFLVSIKESFRRKELGVLSHLSFAKYRWDEKVETFDVKDIQTIIEECENVGFKFYSTDSVINEKLN
jgi:hypothetical protein